jgi:hypothetical protein
VSAAMSPIRLPAAENNITQNASAGSRPRAAPGAPRRTRTNQDLPQTRGLFRAA